MSAAGNSTVGFVGLGAIGSRIAASLQDAGNRLAVFDTRSEAMASPAERGALVCSKPAEVADLATTVLVSLPTPEVVREVVCGEDGLLGGSAIDTFVDLSTTGPETARDLARALADREVGYLDAPVSGGVAGAEAGTLAILASGEERVFDSVAPLLEPFGGSIVRVGGEPGQGQIAKLLNNLLSATALAVTSEAVTLGVGAGLEPGPLLEAFNAGSGRNSATAAKFPKHVLGRGFDAGFRLRLMLKDLRLCLDEARAQGQPMFVGSTVEQLWALAGSRVEEDADHTEIVRLFEDWAAVTIEGEREVAHPHA
jgi:3-hydroxyisobutyrate dehydrogenase-like beta-hydroxyacid dehydrogenase